MQGSTLPCSSLQFSLAGVGGPGRFPGSTGVGEEDPKEREMLRMAIGITRAENSHFLREYGIGLCLFPKGELWSFL